MFRMQSIASGSGSRRAFPTLIPLRSRRQIASSIPSTCVLSSFGTLSARFVSELDVVRRVLTTGSRGYSGLLPSRRESLRRGRDMLDRLESQLETEQRATAGFSEFNRWITREVCGVAPPVTDGVSWFASHSMVRENVIRELIDRVTETHLAYWTVCEVCFVRVGSRLFVRDGVLVVEADSCRSCGAWIGVSELDHGATLDSEAGSVPRYIPTVLVDDQMDRSVVNGGSIFSYPGAIGHYLRAEETYGAGDLETRLVADEELFLQVAAAFVAARREGRSASLARTLWRSSSMFLMAFW